MEKENKNKNRRDITIYINRIETKKIPLETAMNKNMTIMSIVMREIVNSPEIQKVDEFFVNVNGKNVMPKNAKNVQIEDVETIEIFDKVHRLETTK